MSKKGFLGVIAGALAIAGIGATAQGSLPAEKDRSPSHKKTIMPAKKWSQRASRLRLAKASRNTNHKKAKHG